MRTLPMLNEGGVSVMVVPREFLSSRSEKLMRSNLLKMAHVMGAYRLPTKSIVDGKMKGGVFTGVTTPIDVIFLQARGGVLKNIPKEDQYIYDGSYFDNHPDHILGSMVKPGESYTVNGKTIKNTFIYDWIVSDKPFEKLPSFAPRPIYKAKKLDFKSIIKDGKSYPKTKIR